MMTAFRCQEDNDHRYELFKKSVNFIFCTKSYHSFTLCNTKYNHISVIYIQINNYMAKSLKFLMKKGTWQSIACLSAG